MRMIHAILLLLSVTLCTHCAGCGPLEDLNNTRGEGGGMHVPWDGDRSPDAGGTYERTDAAGSFDVGPSRDAAGADLAPSEDVGGEVGAVDLAVADLEPPGPVCGDGIVEAPETCDDGTTADCEGTNDGGDGTCVAAGTCVAGFVFDGADCVPEQLTQHVHIHVANDCSIMVDPPELNVPRGQTVKFAWHNHSQFYAVDVWQSYIGGFTDLAPGQTWNEQFEWCFNVNPYVGYSDISSAPGCPEHRFFITCNGR